MGKVIQTEKFKLARFAHNFQRGLENAINAGLTLEPGRNPTCFNIVRKEERVIEKIFTRCLGTEVE